MTGMTYTHVIHRAVDILNAAAPDPKEVEVAAATLVAASDADIAPPGSAGALWSYILKNPTGSFASQAGHAIARKLPFDEKVHAAVVSVVSTPDSDADVFETAITVLQGKGYAARVTPEVLLAVSECSLRKGRHTAMFVPQLVETVHDVAGGLPVPVLRAIRDGWSRSSDEDQRYEAPEMGRLLPELDLEWLRLMLADASSKVRRATAQTIYRLPTPEKTVVVLEDRIGRETHADVLAALHEAKADIARELQRQARRR
jgi:hypothetical protein